MADARTLAATLVAMMSLLVTSSWCGAAIRDGGVDPENLGKGEWLFSVMDATNRMGGHVSTVTNLNSMMLWYKSQGVRYIMVKAATSDRLYNGCLPNPQFNTALVNAGKSNGVFVFGYNRSYGSNIVGEIAISDYVFQQGADGFVWDAEVEWETRATNPWITNGPAQAWALCSAVRSNWPTKFLAHAPFPIISLHSSFPYKEFGYFSDAVMPQIYHFSTAGIQRSPSAAINWSDVNWHKWQNDVRALPPSTIGGITIYWTNAIKPLAPVHDVYGATGALLCNGSAPAHPDEDVAEFIDYLSADPHTATPGGYRGVNFWRTDLHSSGQLAHIKAGASGNFPGVVNNIVLDDRSGVYVGSWTHVRTFGATTTAATYYGATGTDTNSFGTNYFYKARGTGAAFVDFSPNIAVDGYYNVYQWHPYITNAATNVPFIISHAAGSTTNLVNQSTNHGFWSFVGQYPFRIGALNKVRITDGFTQSNAIALIDGLKLVYVAPSSVPAAPASLAASNSGPTELTLVWTDIPTNELSYVVTRNTAATGTFSNVAFLPPNSTRYTDTGLTPGTTYYYRVRATNSLGASADSNLASATTPIPPSITAHPTNRTVVAGADTTFSIVASGTAPLRYQWRHEGVDVATATNSTFTRSNAQPSHAGNYSVVVMNAGGTNYSSNALLTVLVPPAITSQPQSQTIRVNSNATFTVIANGSAPLAYQWRFNGTDIPDAISNSYTRFNAQTNHSGVYSVLVTNSAGSTISSNAVLTVRIPDASEITQILLITDTHLRLTVTGEPGSYAIERSSSLTNWLPIATVTNASGSFTYEGDITNALRWFYRARLLP